MAATVRLGNKAQKLQGSGVIIGRNGASIYVLTADHLIGKGEGLEISVFSKASYPQPSQTFAAVEVIARNKDADLALLRIVSREAPPGTLRLCPADQAPAEFPAAALTLGCEQGNAPSSWLDKIAGKKQVRKPAGEVCLAWELAREPAQGRSGGPLLDRRGLLIGVCSGKNDDKGYCTHLDEIHRFLKEQRYDWLAKPAKD